MTSYVSLSLVLLIQSVACSQFDPTSHRGWHLFNDKTCGIRTQQRVVGGKEASIGEFPWVVKIYFQKQGEIVSVSCAGGIISEQFVLTAAHCEPAYAYAGIIVAGELDYLKGPDCNSNNICAPLAKIYKMEKFIPHPEYYNFQIGRDIALVKIEDKFQFNDFIAPLCLEYGSLLSEDYSGLDAEFAGWGAYKIDPVNFATTGPSMLQKIILPVLNATACKQAIQFVSNSYYYDQQEYPSFICAGGVEANQHIYFGDSGGVLVIPNSVAGDIPRFFAVGVCTQTSNETPRVTPVADVYSRVSFYMEWIMDTIAYESGIDTIVNNII